MTQDSDATDKLLRRLAAGDRGAFDRLFAMHRSDLRRAVELRLDPALRGRVDASDVDNTLATALIDRLMHHGEAIVIRGDSYRMKDKKADSNDQPAPAGRGPSGCLQRQDPTLCRQEPSPPFGRFRGCRLARRLLTPRPSPSAK